MTLRIRPRFWQNALLASAGLLPVTACGGSAAMDGGAAGLGGGPSAGSGGSASAGQGGAGAGAVGGLGGGGAVAGMAGSGGATNPHPCLNPTLAGAGFELCDGGWVHRSHKTACAPNAANLCTSDADCGAGRVCECALQGARCVTATCSEDADCAAGFLCASQNPDATSLCSFSGNGVGLACQTPGDLCMSDSECGVCSGCSALSGGARQCMACCAVGRPFLVAGTARTAAFAARGDWLHAEVEPDLGGLGPEMLRALGEAWLRAAAMEHASVAAFARFTLELMSLGAPADLIDDSTRAMSDESSHAKLCFGLASAYLGCARGPGPLQTHDSLLGRDLRAIVVTAVREGCIGETVAALEAVEALERATDPAVRAVLERISADEMRHAALAWRFVHWALGQGASGLEQAVHAEFRAALAEDDVAWPSATSPTSPHAARLLGHGILAEAQRHELRRQVLRDLIGPCSAALFQARPSAGQPRADACV